MTDEIKVRKRKLSEFRPAAINPNLGSERGSQIIENSIHTNGAGRSGLSTADGEMIAGSQTIEQMAAAGIEEIIEVETDGHQWVIVKRTDLQTIDDPKARGLQLSDNNATIHGYTQDDAVTAALLADIQAQDAALLRGTGFSAGEVEYLLSDWSDQVAQDFGTEIDDTVFWPEIKLKVPPDVFDRFEQLMAAQPGDTPHEKFSRLLNEHV